MPSAYVICLDPKTNTSYTHMSWSLVLYGLVCAEGYIICLDSKANTSYKSTSPGVLYCMTSCMMSVVLTQKTNTSYTPTCPGVFYCMASCMPSAYTICLDSKTNIFY